MNNAVIKKDDEIIMKLLHYFITDKNYNPVILHGAKDEIWLENLESDYKIIRIVSNYIHNDDQLEMDLYKTKSILKNIQKKTLSFNMNTLSIFINIGDNVHFEDEVNYNNITCVSINNINDLKKHNTIIEYFPDIQKKTTFKEKGINLFMKLSDEINLKTKKDSDKAEELFKPKKPIVTYTIILINIIAFLLMYVLGNGSTDARTLIEFGANYGPLVKLGDYYRLITCAFLHIGPIHLLLNCYAIYIIGPQIENFFGKTKYIILYLVSALSASLLSIIFSDSISAGASGAIFGLLGSLLYFGYHYRVYLGNVIKSQIIPLILINLFYGFIVSGIDNAAHIGGLIGGILISMGLGVKYKSSKSEQINGYILTTIFLAFLIYLGFFK